ncbi:hypothetical protein ACWD4N_47550 [Streptomyces sp. NPDC002586]
MDTTLTPAAQAIYLSELPTGSLLTPHDTGQIRTTAVAELGFKGLRRNQHIAALIPQDHQHRHTWARAAALFADPEGHQQPTRSP